jgi:hypothetical protein
MVDYEISVQTGRADHAFARSTVGVDARWPDCPDAAPRNAFSLDDDAEIRIAKWTSRYFQQAEAVGRNRHRNLTPAI